MFVRLRDKELTLDQVKARLNNAHFGVKYVVLDDLKDSLNPLLFLSKKEQEEMVSAKATLRSARLKANKKELAVKPEVPHSRGLQQVSGTSLEIN